MLFASALRCCPGQLCEICVHPSPKEGTGQVMLDYVPQQKIQIPNDSTYTSIPHSLFPTNGNIFKKVVISKILFPSLSIHFKKMYFQILGKALQRTLWPPQRVHSAHTAASSSSWTRATRLLLCHSVRSAGKWQAYCQMEYYTILAPKRDVKSCRAIACCSRKKSALVTLPKCKEPCFSFQQRNPK